MNDWQLWGRALRRVVLIFVEFDKDNRQFEFRFEVS